MVTRFCDKKECHPQSGAFRPGSLTGFNSPVLLRGDKVPLPFPLFFFLLFSPFLLPRMHLCSLAIFSVGREEDRSFSFLFFFDRRRRRLFQACLGRSRILFPLPCFLSLPNRRVKIAINPFCVARFPPPFVLQKRK